MKRLFLLLSLTLLGLASCKTDETDITYALFPSEILGRWTPETAGNSCDRYIEFESGQCFTYLNASSQFFIDGYIHQTGTPFTLMNARYCHLTADNPPRLVLDGKDAGPLLHFSETDPASQKTEEVLVINQARYRRVKGILQKSIYQFNRVVLDPEQFDPSLPGEKTLFLETGKSLRLTCKLYLDGKPQPMEEDLARECLNWISMDERTVTVDGNGNLTLHKNGDVIIKVRTYDASCSDACRLIVGGGDLSKNGTANCYVTSQPGRYRFLPTRGKQPESIGSIQSVDVLWETFNTAESPSASKPVVRNVHLSANKDSVCFEVPYPMNNGNAVIAARNAGGDILWSWHVWVCRGFDPEKTGQLYYDGYAKAVGTMMDRNLGALNLVATSAASYGLFYQWGRKDPFPGQGSQAANGPCVYTLGEVPKTLRDATTGTLAYATAHPMELLVEPEGASSGDWIDGEALDSLWTGKKTVYDPCPPGWRVPDGTVLDANDKVTEYGIWLGTYPNAATTTNRARYPSTSYCRIPGTVSCNLADAFHVRQKTCLYPTAGRINANGVYTQSNGRGYYWSCKAEKPDSRRSNALTINYQNNSYGLYFSTLTPGWFSCGYRAQGCNVRCQKME